MTQGHQLFIEAKAVKTQEHLAPNLHDDLASRLEFA
jgi:hypothetical protein